MRPHNNAFCRIAAETFDCPGPVYEFGSFQVQGQEQYSNLREYFPGKNYTGCDFRQGPGVDRVEDVTAIRLPDCSAGTVLCIETFEHVFEVRKAFDEVFRILKPGGVFLLTSPFNFKIHGYPDDYWRITPSCLRRMLSPYGGRIVGGQGHPSFPHTVMSLGIKTPAPSDFKARAEAFRDAYCRALRQEEAALPMGQKIRRTLGNLYRSRGERNFVKGYYTADLAIDVVPTVLAKVG